MSLNFRKTGVNAENLLTLIGREHCTKRSGDSQSSVLTLLLYEAGSFQLRLRGRSTSLSLVYIKAKLKKSDTSKQD